MVQDFVNPQYHVVDDSAERRSGLWASEPGVSGDGAAEKDRGAGGAESSCGREEDTAGFFSTRAKGGWAACWAAEHFLGIHLGMAC